MGDKVVSKLKSAVPLGKADWEGPRPGCRGLSGAPTPLLGVFSRMHPLILLVMTSKAEQHVSSTSNVAAAAVLSQPNVTGVRLTGFLFL